MENSSTHLSKHSYKSIPKRIKKLRASINKFPTSGSETGARGRGKYFPMNVLENIEVENNEGHQLGSKWTRYGKQVTSLSRGSAES
jgi:hypothetical protein